MASRTTLLFFVLSVVLSVYAQQPFEVSRTGNITFDAAFNFTFTAPNFKTSALLTVNTSNVVICIQEKYDIPAGSQFSNETCTYFFNMTEHTTGVSIYLRNLVHHIGVYFATSDVTPTNVTGVTVTLKGDTCAANSFGPSCKPAILVTNEKGEFTVQFRANTQWQYLVYEAPELLGSITIQPAKATDSLASVKIRYAGAPTSDVYDAAEVTNGLHFVAPRPGQWVIGVQSADAGSYTFSYNILNCKGASGVGEACNTTYITGTAQTNNMTLTAFPGQYTYWKFVSTPSTPLWVSVTTLDKTHLPYVFVSKGNIPYKGNADVMNCNQGYCNVVRSIKVNNSATETWFIGVTASVTTGNTTFGIWFNSTCAPECEDNNHGTCQFDGTCDCQIDHTGIDCTLSKGLGPQYIVLIIIASLVVASAIIGFVAWAYMRRKRVNYELVS